MFLEHFNYFFGPLFIWSSLLGSTEVKIIYLFLALLLYFLVEVSHVKSKWNSSRLIIIIILDNSAVLWFLFCVGLIIYFHIFIGPVRNWFCYLLLQSYLQILIYIFAIENILRFFLFWFFWLFTRSHHTKRIKIWWRLITLFYLVGFIYTLLFGMILFLIFCLKPSILLFLFAIILYIFFATRIQILSNTLFIFAINLIKFNLIIFDWLPCR